MDWTDTAKLANNLALAVIGMLYFDAGKGKLPGEIAEIQRDSQPFGAGLRPNNVDLNFRRSRRSVQRNHAASLTDLDLPVRVGGELEGQTRNRNKPGFTERVHPRWSRYFAQSTESLNFAKKNTKGRIDPAFTFRSGRC